MNLSATTLPTRNFLVIVITIASSLAMTSQSSAELITNGSFEQFNIPESSWDVPGSHDNFAHPSSAIVGWETTQGRFTYNRLLWNNTDGIASIDLASVENSASALGGIEQSFSTESGSRYLLSFDVGKDPHTDGSGGPSVKQLRVEVAGVNLLYTVDSTGFDRPENPWRNEIISFTADSGTASLRFTAITPGAANITLDNVSVVSVPEPSTSFVAFCGLAILGARRRVRTRLA